MLNHFVNQLLASVVQDRFGRKGPFKAGTIVPQLDVTVATGLQASQPCARCAAWAGAFRCEPPDAITHEWRYTGAGLDLVIVLRKAKEKSEPHLRAIIIVEHGSRVHALATYDGQPLNVEGGEGPWTLKKVSEEAECNCVFPTQIEVTQSVAPVKGPNFDLLDPFQKRRGRPSINF